MEKKTETPQRSGDIRKLTAGPGTIKQWTRQQTRLSPRKRLIPTLEKHDHSVRARDAGNVLNM